MKIIAFFLISALMALFINIKESPGLRTRVYIKVPLVSFENGELYNSTFTDSNFSTRYRDWVFLELDRNDIIYDEFAIRERKKGQDYFIYKMSDTFGYFLPDLNTVVWKKVSVDSIERARMLSYLTVDTFSCIANPDTPISVFNKSGDLIRVFNNKYKRNVEDISDIRLWYSKNKYGDSLRTLSKKNGWFGDKGLFKVEYFYNKYYWKEAKTEVPKRVLSVETSVATEPLSEAKFEFLKDCIKEFYKE